MAKGRPKASPEQIEIDERQIAALNLRRAGATYQQIADECGFAGPSGAYDAVRSALNKARSEPADDLRELELSRLDEMQTGLWEGAISGDSDAVNAVLRLMGHRARLLGLERRESPIKTKLPKLSRPEDGMAVMSELLEKATTGELLPEEAGKLAALVSSFMRIAETTGLAEQLAELKELAQANYEKEKANEKHGDN